MTSVPSDSTSDFSSVIADALKQQRRRYVVGALASYAPLVCLAVGLVYVFLETRSANGALRAQLVIERLRRQASIDSAMARAVIAARDSINQVRSDAELRIAALTRDQVVVNQVVRALRAESTGELARRLTREEAGTLISSAVGREEAIRAKSLDSLRMRVSDVDKRIGELQGADSALAARTSHSISALSSRIHTVELSARRAADTSDLRELRQYVLSQLAVKADTISLVHARSDARRALGRAAVLDTALERLRRDLAALQPSSTNIP